MNTNCGEVSRLLKLDAYYWVYWVLCFPSFSGMMKVFIC